MVDITKKAVISTNTYRGVGYGVVCLILVFLSLYLLGSKSQTSRLAGLASMFAAAMVAWFGERVRYRSLYPNTPTENRGHYVVIALALAGVLGFLIPPDNVFGVFRYLFVLLARILAHQ